MQMAILDMQITILEHASILGNVLLAILLTI
jgi:hypothetical protein